MVNEDYQCKICTEQSILEVYTDGRHIMQCETCEAVVVLDLTTRKETWVGAHEAPFVIEGEELDSYWATEALRQIHADYLEETLCSECSTKEEVLIGLAEDGELSLYKGCSDHACSKDPRFFTKTKSDMRDLVNTLETFDTGTFTHLKVILMAYLNGIPVHGEYCAQCATSPHTRQLRGFDELGGQTFCDDHTGESASTGFYPVQYLTSQLLSAQAHKAIMARAKGDKDVN